MNILAQLIAEANASNRNTYTGYDKSCDSYGHSITTLRILVLKRGLNLKGQNPRQLAKALILD